MGSGQKDPKKLYSAICRSKIDYGCQLYGTAIKSRLKKLDSIHREGIRIYTGAFKTSPMESLHVEANEPALDKRRNKLGLRFLYRLRSNPTYNCTLITLDSTEDRNFEENGKITRPVGVHYRNIRGKIYGETKGDREEQYATTTTMDNK